MFTTIRDVSLVLAATAAALAAQRPLEVAGLPLDAPLTVDATASSTELVVEVDILPEWHLYARDTGGGQPVTLALEPASSYRAAGALALPATADGKIRGKARIALPIARRGDGSRVVAKLRFMACDPLVCLPPMEVVLSGDAGDLAAAGAGPRTVLLVARESGDRSRRIAAFLTERGFAPTVTTYAEVDAALCDRHDVVLADSELFEHARAVTRTVWKFPKTRSPIVAVGFLGTELIEKHGLAMTSGYI